MLVVEEAKVYSRGIIKYKLKNGTEFEAAL
jgi:hypothetical protein